MACIFCAIIAGEQAAEIVFEDENSIAFLDNRPLFAGHTLLAPKAHWETMLDVPAPGLGPLFGACQKLAAAVEKGMGAEGTFVAINNRVSQSVPHLHIHVVPRRRKDGLKGFFWPRYTYGGEEEIRATADAIRSALAEIKG